MSRMRKHNALFTITKTDLSNVRFISSLAFSKSAKQGGDLWRYIDHCTELLELGFDWTMEQCAVVQAFPMSLTVMRFKLD